MRPSSACSISVGDALAAPHLVLVVVEGAADNDRVERPSVGGGENLRVDDVGVARRARAGDDGENPRMVGGEHGELGRPSKAIGRNSKASFSPPGRRRRTNSAWRTCRSSSTRSQ